jgi:hypothetical protein
MHFDRHTPPLISGPMDSGEPSMHQHAQQTPDDLLTLIDRHLPSLWQAHAACGNRSLRTLLHVAETMLAQRAGVDVPTFRTTRRRTRRQPRT